ncbi:MAG TPA: rubrerythrin family protein [Clostridiales bacterium]|nr:rubrerythrin family protein [Clostridiales bacterium]
MDFQQSRTYQNLLNAYDYELMSSTIFELYADQARRETLIEISNVFDIITRNNKELARIWLRQINQGVLPNTSENLYAGIQTENYAGNTMYRSYAEIANEEGYTDIASLFNGVANIKLNHASELQPVYENVIRNEVFCKPVSVLWICMSCGNILSGLCAPVRCPVCGLPQGYYRVYSPV